MNEQDANDIVLKCCHDTDFQQESGAARVDNSVCAIVVTYYPDSSFDERIKILLPQVEQIVVVDNTPEESRKPRCETALQNMAQMHFIENQNNLGIAAALNQGLEHALKEGFRWVLTLDQDTQCYPDMVDTLIKVASATKTTPMVIGGNYLDPYNRKTKFPVGEAEESLKQKTVITSGCLINSIMAAAIGKFREDYFIDQVDHEFCLRARAHGHQIVATRKPVMIHSVGAPGGVRLPLLGVLPNHPPLRKYYIARNTLVTIVQYWRREPQWCLRRLIRLLLGLGEMALLEKQRYRKVRAFAGGIVDGLHRRMGPCSRESIAKPEPAAHF